MKRSKEFFENIGFTPNEKHTGAEMACFEMGEKKTIVLFFAEEKFKEFTKSAIADVKASAEILISFDAASREAVDEMARKSESFPSGEVELCYVPLKHQG